MKELYLIIKNIILDIDSPFVEGEKLFNTVKVDKGQFERIIHSSENSEFPYTFPAVFIHFINVAYTTSQNRINTGTGTMRIRFILNRLNDQDDEFETEIFDYAEYLNAAIQDAKNSKDVGIQKCNLSYFDMPTSSNQLQPCWIDYEVNFIDQSGDKYRTWVERVITTPAFTNRSDVEGESREDIEIDSSDQPSVADSLDELTHLVE